MDMEASTLVIKVKYGDFLRRFNASVMDDKLDLSMHKLIEKIRILFNFATDTELTLTYIDEDGEMVTLVDDDDLLDAVEQVLNPLRITVTTNEEKNSSPFICSTGSSIPSSSPKVQLQFQNTNSGVSEILKTIPDPLRETLAKLSTDLVSKVFSSAPGITPGIAEIVEYFSKVGLSYLSHISEPQARVHSTAQNDIPESKATVTETKDSDSSKVDPTQSKAQSQGLSEKQLSRNNVGSQKLESVATMKIHEVKVEPSHAFFSAPFVANNVSTEEKVNKASGPQLGPIPAFFGVHDCVKGDPLDGRTKHRFPCDFGNSPRSLIDPNPGSFSNFPGSFFSPFHAYECQFSGIPVENISTALPQPASQAVSFERNRSQNDVNGMMGKDNAYNRIDLPEIHPHQWPSKGLHDFGHCSLESQVHRGMEVSPGVSNLDSCFIVDVTMIDGALITPLTPFTKIWRMRNNGTTFWPKKTQLVWIGGDKLSNTFSVELQVPAIGLAVNQELDVAVDFISPDVPGRYVSYWRMAAPSGQRFGQHVRVHIQVHATIAETQHGVPGLNLNLPLVNNVLAGPEINNAVMDLLVEDSRPVEVFEPITPLPKIEHDTKFPISVSSMVGSGATNLAPTAPSSIFYPVIDQSDMATPVYPPPYVHYLPLPPPGIFPKTSPLLYTLPAPPVVCPPPPPPPPSQSLLYPPPPHAFYPPPPPLPPPVTFPPHPASLYTSTSPPLFNSWPPPAAGNTREYTEELQGMEELEKKLLRELEEMGFKQVDLNKEILRFYEYDLQKTLKDLC